MMDRNGQAYLPLHNYVTVKVDSHLTVNVRSYVTVNNYAQPTVDKHKHFTQRFERSGGVFCSNGGGGQQVTSRKRRFGETGITQENFYNIIKPMNNFEPVRKIRRGEVSITEEKSFCHVQQNQPLTTGLRSSKTGCSERRKPASTWQSNLPLDPNRWTHDHVVCWLHHVARKHNFQVEVDKFRMNGKGLCFMTLDGFRSRSPLGGALLHADLKQKLKTRIYHLISRSNTS